MFNFVLCFISTNFFTLAPFHVILSEISILIITSIIVIANYSKPMDQWVLFALFLFFCWILLSIFRGEVNIKIVRDIIIVPVFVMLGISRQNHSISKLLVVIQLFTLVTMIFEMVSPNDFTRFFNVMKYYIDTRDFSSESFWNEESDLFVSATRPGERFFPFFGSHRLSAVFLEPVSLGNYAVIIAMVLITLPNIFSRIQIIFMCISNVLLLFGCDGRLAFGVCLGIGCLPLLSRMRLRPVILLPFTIFISLILVECSNTVVGEDNLLGRLGGTFHLLASFRPGDLFGYSLELWPSSMDSGLAYTLVSQSMPISILIWCFIFCRPVRSETANRIMIGVALYLSANLMVSYSLYSIKTAALLWYVFGIGINCLGVSPLRSIRDGLPRNTI